MFARPCRKQQICGGFLASLVWPPSAKCLSSDNVSTSQPAGQPGRRSPSLFLQTVRVRRRARPFRQPPLILLNFVFAIEFAPQSTSSPALSIHVLCLCAPHMLCALSVSCLTLVDALSPLSMCLPSLALSLSMLPCIVHSHHARASTPRNVLVHHWRCREGPLALGEHQLTHLTHCY